jgi:hypothetical protein
MTKEVVENIAKQILKPAERTRAGEHVRTLRARFHVAEAVVLSAFLRIAQNGIGFPDLLESVFRLLVAAGLVRVILVRKFPVRLADIFLGGVSRNT